MPRLAGITLKLMAGAEPTPRLADIKVNLMAGAEPVSLSEATLDRLGKQTY